MISKTMRAILHALSYGNIEVESSRRLVDIKKLDAMNIFLKKMDIHDFQRGLSKSLCGFIFLLKKR